MSLPKGVFFRAKFSLASPSTFQVPLLCSDSLQAPSCVAARSLLACDTHYCVFLTKQNGNCLCSTAATGCAGGMPNKNCVSISYLQKTCQQNRSKACIQCWGHPSLKGASCRTGTSSLCSEMWRTPQMRAGSKTRQGNDTW